VSPRLLALLLIVAASGLHVGLALPMREDASRSLSEERRLRGTMRESRTRVASLERREVVRRRNAGMVSSVAPADPVALRRALLDSLRGARVSGVRLEVHAGRAPIGATAHVSAEGASAEVLRLSGHLVRPGSGVAIERVHFSPTPAGLAFDMDAFSLVARP
jgi:hypothetical protein